MLDRLLFVEHGESLPVKTEECNSSLAKATEGRQWWLQFQQLETFAAVQLPRNIGTLIFVAILRNG